MTRLILSAAARQQIEEAALWWRNARPAAPRMLGEEVASAFRRILRHPGIARRVDHPRRTNVRCAVLGPTGYLLYYEFNPEQDRIEVLALWSAYRGRGPF